MHSGSETTETNNENANKYLINIDFGVVQVGSVHKRSIDVTNNLKASSRFFVFFLVIIKNYDIFIRHYILLFVL